ncbi:phage major capsid protein [Dongia deserti]|uniref:phage major capsid protein n=1 Tax=Dongia deserti TaxID=2268030 RepID=UPI0013C49077|nr:phage major capsid protein [Dongia deserti]
MSKSRLPAVSLAVLCAADRPAGVIGTVRNDEGDVSARLMRTLAEVKVELTRVGDEQAKKIEKLEDRIDALQTRNEDLEKVVAARTGVLARLRYGGASASSFVAALEPDVLRNAAKGCEAHGRSRFTVNAAILSGPPNGPSGARDHRPEIIGPAQRAVRVRDLMTVTTTGSGTVEYNRETGFTNNARPVTEGEEKPESTLTFELVTATPITIAHTTRASKQILADEPRLQSFLDGRMRYGVQLKEDQQLLFGSGTGQNLSGLTIDATAFAAPTGLSLTSKADFIGAAIAQLRAIDHEPDGIVMHPTDWQLILQEKAEDGHYLIPGGPLSTAEPMLFKKPVALSTAMERDKFLVGQFAIGCELFEREETAVEISTEDRDNFVKNLVTVRAEERVVLATYRPEAFVYGDFGLIT